MNPDTSYFFCGIGGSGMLPLALILVGRGVAVEGSDRSLDQGRTAQKFDFLRAKGVTLHPQDGSGVTRPSQIVVASTAVEDTVPDIQAAKRVGAPVMSRAQLLAEIFNAAPCGVAVGGTSGKSTTTGMIGWILHQAGRGPTIMNGAVMKNFMTKDALFASALVGQGDEFVSEVDESDGSIALYAPRVAVLNNVALDHKTMDELRVLFGDFIAKADTAILNMDNEETALLAARVPEEKRRTFSLRDKNADFYAGPLTLAADGVTFDVTDKRAATFATLRLKLPGAHNGANALAAIAAARALGVPLDAAVKVLSQFTGIRRRLELVGAAGGVAVIDDFAHNPDKIAATLQALKTFPGRLLVMFQPHGFGPIKLMKQQFIDVFAAHLGPDDVLLMPEPVYFGGTVDRSAGSADITNGVIARGKQAFAYAERAQCGETLLALAHPGDRIVIMGARDDTLSTFAEELLQRLASAS